MPTRGIILESCAVEAGKRGLLTNACIKLHLLADITRKEASGHGNIDTLIHGVDVEVSPVVLLMFPSTRIISASVMYYQVIDVDLPTLTTSLEFIFVLTAERQTR